MKVSHRWKPGLVDSPRVWGTLKLNPGTWSHLSDPDELEKNYGMGSIVWTPALQRINSPGDEYAKVQGDEKAKPLSRKVPIKWKLLNPYR